MENNVKIIRSGRKTVSIGINASGEITVRAPYSMSDKAIGDLLCSKRGWIEKHLSRLTPKSDSTEPFTSGELARMSEKTREAVLRSAQKYSGELGVRYGRITVRATVSRWGSCSSDGNLSFSCLLSLMPEDVLDYVVVHELCHLREMNHSASFWREVERIMPDYKERREYLRQNGGELSARLRETKRKGSVPINS